MTAKHDVKIAFHTLGCKLNFTESAHLLQLAKEEGFTTSLDSNDIADVYVINTCSVTENADKECRYLIRKFKRQAPESLIIITGCYAQLQPESIQQMEGVDMVLGVSEKFQLHRHLESLLNKTATPHWGCHVDEVNTFHSALSFDSRTRAFLKVQDGCDYSCSFCTIPMARGKSRSDISENVLHNITTLHKMGSKEIVLTGINLGDYTCPTSGKNLLQLLELIEAYETHDIRFRISSIEPNLVSDEIIHLVANSKKIVPHFHIPLQSGSNKILGLMRRRYQNTFYADRILQIKSKIPDCAIGVDVICGFPTETEEDFEISYDFIQHLPISYLHVFTYSGRPNTKAVEMLGHVPQTSKKKYNHLLQLLSSQKQAAFHTSQIGKKRPVLFEKKENGTNTISGYTDNYIKIETIFDSSLINQVVEWTI